jgi:hypothetical protein
MYLFQTMWSTAKGISFAVSPWQLRYETREYPPWSGRTERGILHEKGTSSPGSHDILLVFWGLCAFLCNVWSDTAVLEGLRIRRALERLQMSSSPIPPLHARKDTTIENPCL